MRRVFVVPQIGYFRTDMIETPNLALVPRTLQEARDQIEAMPPEWRAQVSPDWLAMLEQFADVWVLGFNLFHRRSNIQIGQCGYKGPPDTDGAVEIAYAIEMEHQRKGYATEAARGLVDFASQQDHVLIVRAHTLPVPGASSRVLEKAGFTFTGSVIDKDDGEVWRWEIAVGA